MEKSRFSSDESGFSIAEVIIATGLLAGALISLAQMFAVATASNTSARSTTYATVLAEQKIEQLRGLTWGFDTLGLPLTDGSTNTAVSPESPTGGTGLSPSPPDALGTNADGYVDYIDRLGQVIGGGVTVPASAVYIRRWSIEPLPTNPNNTLILQVLVTRNRDRGAAASSGTVKRLRDEARLMSVKTRKTQ